MIVFRREYNECCFIKIEINCRIKLVLISTINLLIRYESTSILFIIIININITFVIFKFHKTAYLNLNIHSNEI